MNVRKVRVGTVALLLATAMTVSACGDDDDGASTNVEAPTPGGAPIELGLINTENSPAGNYVDNRKGAEAAIKYVNAELGGVNGRPLEVETCITDGSPESSIGCANKFAQAKKLAVMPGIDFGAAAAVPIYTQNNIPYVGGLFVSPAEYTAPTGYSFLGAAAGAVTGLAAYAGQELQAKKVVVVAQDVPQASAAIDGFMKPVFAKVGVTEVSSVLEAATAADWTPAMTRAKDGDPDAFILLAGGPACTKMMQAIATLAIPTEKVLFAQECANKDQISAGNGGGDGALYQSSMISPDADDPNAKLFREKVDQYSDVAPGITTQVGFDSVMILFEMLKSLSPDNITRETLVSALKSPQGRPGFMSHGFVCDGKRFPGLPALCDTNVRFLKFEDGEFADPGNEWVDGAAVLAGR